MDWLLSLPSNQRLLVYSGTAALVVLLYIFIFYFPQSGQITEEQQTIQSLQDEKAKLQTLLKNRPQTEASIKEVEAQFNQAKAQLPEEKEIPELLKQVSNLGRDSGLDVVLFRQKPEAFQDLYAEVPVEMAVRGGYHQIALFFDKVRRMDRIVNVSDINIKNPQPIGGQMQIDASFAATTYRFLSEEERARIAKEKEEAEKNKGKRKRNTK